MPQQHMKYTRSRKNWKKIIKRHFCLSFSLLYLFLRSCKFAIVEALAYELNELIDDSKYVIGLGPK